MAVAPAPLLLLCVAEFPRSRLGAAAGLLIAALPILVTLCFGPRRALWIRIAALDFTLCLVSSATVLVASPTRQRVDDRVFEYYGNGSKPFARFSIANVIPELDQLRVIFTLTPALDRLFTWEQARALKRSTSEVYWEMAGDEAFRALGSAMPAVHAAVLGQPPPARHCFVYIPTAVSHNAPAPVIVFFHGGGGNFKAYLWILAQVAEQTRSILVAPTGGMGNWNAELTNDAFALALEAAASRATVDPQRIHVIGLSNGGLAIAQLLRQPEVVLESVVAISPVLSEQRPLRRVHHFPPVLILSGTDDDRVPLSYVERNAESLRRDGYKVTLLAIPNADHFLFFSHRALVISKLTQWIRISDPSPVPSRE